jgi:hypothetical protein
VWFDFWGIAKRLKCKNKTIYEYEYDDTTITSRGGNMLGRDRL